MKLVCAEHTEIEVGSFKIRTKLKPFVGHHDQNCIASCDEKAHYPVIVLEAFPGAEEEFTRDPVVGRLVTRNYTLALTSFKADMRDTHSLATIINVAHVYHIHDSWLKGIAILEMRRDQTTTMPRGLLSVRALDCEDTQSPGAHGVRCFERVGACNAAALGLAKSD